MNNEANSERFRIDRKENIFILFKPSEALFKKYVKFRHITITLWSNDVLGNFLQKFSHIECASHNKRLYNACVCLKRYISQRTSPKCQRLSWVISRSSRLEVCFKSGALENFAKFTGNPLYRSLFLIRLQSSDPQLHLKKDSSTDVFL